MGTYTTGLGAFPFSRAYPGALLCHHCNISWPVCSVTVNNTPDHSLPFRDLFLIFVCISVVPQAADTIDEGVVVPCPENKVLFLRNQALLLLSAGSALSKAR